MISPAASVDDSAQIGPYVVVGGPVVIGPGVRLHAHAVVYGPTRLDADVEVWPMAVVGGDPQDLSYGGGATELLVGPRTVIREGASVHRAAAATPTRIGADCLIMGQVHVGHDSQIGNGVVVSHGAGIAGHVQIGDGAVIGGLAGIHQHVRVGAYAMVGGMAKVIQDVLPCSMVDGNPARHRKINTPGLGRAGVPEGEHAAARAALWAVRDGGPVTGAGHAVDLIASFLKEPSKRGIAPFAHPRNQRAMREA
ncbi:MAG: acyl-ACP--UDP-N-acetylglucosamine O-acyltransferase [Streptosporangiaceae bacterium]|nr:acyl-ACP--UDP-N-acetylglucosamine O-acyltransferase [Streptosporangiaceae bacterium]MBV9855078.1 acyl-ACP--UDP-N-acetylglucosamine O-acyltransferase [Streptosporangiaceae bacterium]